MKILKTLVKFNHEFPLWSTIGKKSIPKIFPCVFLIYITFPGFIISMLNIRNATRLPWNAKLKYCIFFILKIHLLIIYVWNWWYLRIAMVRFLFYCFLLCNLLSLLFYLFFYFSYFLLLLLYTIVVCLATLIYWTERKIVTKFTYGNYINTC